MFKKIRAIGIVFAIAALSAFAHASESSVITEAHFELSQDPIDLGVQSTEVNSFSLTQANSDLALEVEYSEVIKLERSIEPAFVLTTEAPALTTVVEVGWRRSYNL